MSAFAAFAANRTGRSFRTYTELHRFSIDEPAVFWQLLVEHAGVRHSGELDPAMVGTGVERARFFPSLRLSWVENVLAEHEAAIEDAPALVACDETGARTELSRRELRRRVRAVAAALEARGLRPGSRVAAIARNTVETAIACLAVTALGATWSAVALDLGLSSVRARFTRLSPELLVGHRAGTYGGAPQRGLMTEIATELDTVRSTIWLDEGESRLGDLVREGELILMTKPENRWPRFPFDQPLFVLFSSGTSGPPKGIVHGHGGTLIEHLKEHALHCDLGPGDRLLFQTTTGWMMWPWTLSALATGACIVLYDGSVSYPRADALLDVAGREGVTVLGTSPAYLRYMVDADVACPPPLRESLREILSTGSVLTPSLHRWAKERFADVPLHSISGGTDIIGCFVMGSPWTDTRAGESGCIGLGLDVRAWGSNGPARAGIGDLVCLTPFPSRPVALLGDQDGSRLHEGYFAAHEGAWTHGDLIELTPHGSARVLGRCDGVINVRGIRIGPAEIYDVLAGSFPEIAAALAVDQEAPSEPGDRRLVLFVKLDAKSRFDRSFALRIKRELSTRASAAHVPAVIVPVDDLPKTHNGKLSEAAMQAALARRPIPNLAALANPDSIERAIAELRRRDAQPY